jgi:hypothetical protein
MPEDRPESETFIDAVANFLSDFQNFTRYGCHPFVIWVSKVEPMDRSIQITSQFFIIHFSKLGGELPRRRGEA